MTPKSLRALSAQLKWGDKAIASNVQVNAISGVSMPQNPNILSQVLPFEFVTLSSSVYLIATDCVSKI
jgi:hypothetical protein